MTTEPRRPLSKPCAFLAALGLALALLPSAASATSVSVVAVSSIPVSVDASTANVPVISAVLVSNAGNSSLGTFTLNMFGDVPASQVAGSLWRDNGDGVFSGGTPDVMVTSSAFLPPGGGLPPRVMLNASGEPQVTSSGARYFFAVTLNGAPAGRKMFFGFQLGADFNTGNQNDLPLPFYSSSTLVRVRVYARPDNSYNPYAFPVGGATRSGGLDTGLFVESGQRVLSKVVPGDLWDVGTSTNADGIPASEGVAVSSRGALIGRIGTGPWLLLGQTSTITATAAGTLYVANNDGNYSNNPDVAGNALRVAFEVLPATFTKTWVGGTLGFETNADVAQNWIGGRPFPGESVTFGASAYDCDWNIPNLSISSLTVNTAFNKTIRIIQPQYFYQNFLEVTGDAVIRGGLFSMGKRTALGTNGLVVKGRLVVRDTATFDMSDGSISLGLGLEARAGGILKADVGTIKFNRAIPSLAYYLRVDGATVNVTAPSDFSGVDFIDFINATVTAFDAASLTTIGSSTNAYVRFASAGPVTYVFNNWSAGPPPRGTGVFASGLAAGSTVTFNQSTAIGGTAFGSPNTVAAPQTVIWNPDGGGASGGLGGFLTGPTASYTVIASTAANGVNNPALGGGVSITTTTGYYSLSGLRAPGTYFIFVRVESGGNPVPFSPAAGFGFPGLYKSNPVFIPGGAGPPNINLSAQEWGRVDGLVVNNSQQAGPIVVETWEGAPNIVTSTRQARGLATPNYSFQTPASTAAVYHSSAVFAFVDANRNTQWDLFEASATVLSVNVSSFQPTAVATMTIFGGNPAPGGTVSLTTAAVHPGAVGANGHNALIRSRMIASGGPAEFAGMKLRYQGAPLPPPGSSFGIWLDDGDGVFNRNQDELRGTTPLLVLGPSTYTVLLTTPVFISTFTPRFFYVTVDVNQGSGIPYGTAGVMIDSATSYTLSVGTFSAVPAFPSATGAMNILSDVLGTTEATPDGQGGAQASGYFFFPGELVSVTSTGTVKVSPTATAYGPGGQPGTTGLNTVLPSANVGELIGRVSNGGDPTSWIRIGASTASFAATQPGVLRLAINDFVGAYSDNSGSLLAGFVTSGSSVGAISGQVFFSTPVFGSTITITARLAAAPVATKDVVVAVSTSYPFLITGLLPGEYNLTAVSSLSGDFGLSNEKAKVVVGSTPTMNVFMYPNTGGISGTISYGGVQNYGDFRIGVATVTDFSRDVYFFGSDTPSSSAYAVGGLPAPATYYVVGYRDGNANNKPDGTEPLGYKGTPGGGLSSLAAFLTPVYVAGGSTVTSINVPLSDMGAIEGIANLLPGATGALVVEAGRIVSTFGYVTESRVVVPNFGGAPAGGIPYTVGLLRPATDYTLFAFLDKNFDGQPSGGEPQFASPSVIAAPPGNRARQDFSLIALSSPAAPSVFTAVPSLISTITFSWSLVPGATGYQLRRANNSVITSLGASTSVYLDVLLDNTSSQIRAITASNGNGTSTTTVLPQVYYSGARIPGNPVPTAVSSTGTLTTWATGGNPAGTLYELMRATSTPGAQSTVFLGTSTSFFNALAPASTYFWVVRAINANNVVTAFSGSANAITSPLAGPSLSGVLTYGGFQIAGGRGFVIEASTSPTTFFPRASSASLPGASQQPWYLPVAAGTYFVRAYVDVAGNGILQPSADRGQSTSFVVGASSVTGVNFSVFADTVPPGAPAGIVALAGNKKVTLTWVAPTKNANNTNLVDLAGYVVERATAAVAAFQQVTAAALSSTTLTYVDNTPAPGLASFYRLRAVDLGGNLSSPSGAVSAVPSSGGSISGQIRSFSASAIGQYRVRLSTTPAPSAISVAEAALTSYTFTALSDGVYYLRAFRDANGNGVEDSLTEPAGTFGGLNQPFPISIINGNAVTGADATICDRAALNPPFGSGFLTFGACPALDKGPGFVTSLFAISVGGGAAGSLGVGTQVNLAFSTNTAFATDLILLGPDGNVFARDNRVGGANLTATLTQPGIYLAEPMSFQVGATGYFVLNMRLEGGYAGTVVTTVSYAGGQTGPVYAQLYNQQSQQASPILKSSAAAPGAFTFSGLPDGTYYLRGFRDTNLNGVRDNGEASGQFGVASSSALPVVIVGGLALGGPFLVPISDPAVGVIRGAALYDGTASGNLRVEAGRSACANCSSLNEVTAATTVAPGAVYTLPFIPSATDYVVRAFVDSNGNGQPDALESSISTFPINVFVNATSTVSFVIKDSGSGQFGSAIIVGTVTYTGASTGPIVIGLSRDPSFHSIDYLIVMPASGVFTRAGLLGDTSYYMSGFMDLNYSNTPDPASGEPVAAGSDQFFAGTPSLISPPPIYLPSDSTTGSKLTLGDPPNGTVLGTVRYAGAASGNDLIVQAYPVAAAFGDRPVSQVIPRVIGVSTYAYQLNYLSGQSYYISAFLDGNGNGWQDFGEPSGGRPPIAVSAGTGTFPSYGVDLEAYDPGALGAAGTSGRIRGEIVYLGTQSGDLFVRFFNNEDRLGTPLYTLRVSAPIPGSGEFTFDKQNLPFGTYYLDAFRDPSNAGYYNPAAHAHGVLNEGQPVTVSQQNADTYAFGGSITDPGQGGSVNAFTGSFAAAGGARFDGGATDLAAAIELDTTTVGGPEPVVIGVTAQSRGVQVWGVRYSSAGFVQSSAVLLSDDIQINQFVVAGGDVYLTGREEEPGTNTSTATITVYDQSFSEINSAQYADYQGMDGLSHYNGYLYGATRYLPTNKITVLKIDASSLAVSSSAVFNAPGSCAYCQTRAKGGALSPNGAYYVVYAIVNQQGDSDRGLHFLLKYDPSTLALLASKDVTSLGVATHGPGVSMVLDNAGNLYLALTTDGNTARTYKFDVSGAVITQTASTSYGPVQVHFSGGLGNLRVDPSNGHPYEVWESTTGAGDYMLLHYDQNLALKGQRFFDGGGGEDTAFSLAIFDSSNVFVAGALNNGNNLDWGTIKLNGNGSGSASAAGTPVVITTANASNYISGTVTYTGGLVTSGTIRVALIPYYEEVPIRFATAAFGASRPFLFNNLPDDVYNIRAFVDPNGNSNADAGEPVGVSLFDGIPFSSYDGSQQLADPIQLCDRRQIAFDVDVLHSLSAADCTSPDRPGAPHRLYTFYGTRGQPVTIRMNALGFYDSFLDLYGPAGQWLEWDDESAGDGDAQITNYVLPEDGLYTIDAQAYASASFGSFRLSLTGSAGALGGISGAVDYSGQQGGAFIVGLFNSPAFSTSTSLGRLVLTSTRSFSFDYLAAGTTYYLGAFIDVNANNAPDPGEDNGSFGVSGVPSPILLAPGQVATGVQISVAPSTAAAIASSYVTGTASYTGFKTGQLILEFWSNSQFTGHPVATRVVPTGVGPYDATVPAGVPYYVRGFLDANNDFALQLDEPRGVYAPKSQGAEQVFPPAGQTLVGIDLTLRDPGVNANGAIAGEGTAVLTSTFAVAARQATMKIIYTVGANGIASTGSIGFTAPPTFTFPQATFSSSVTVTSTATAFGALTFSGPSVFVTPVTTLVAGQQVVFTWNNFGAPCIVGTATVTVSAAQNGNTPPAPLFLGSPSLAVVPGAAAYAGVADPYFSFKQGELTEERRVETYDNCGNRVGVGSAISVDLYARRFNGSAFVADAEVGVTTGPVLSTAASVTMDFAVGQSSASFYVFSLSTGYKYLEIQSPLSAYSSIIGVQAMPANALTGVSVSSYGTGTGLSSATIALGANGQPTQVFVNFNLGDPNQPWHVLVSSLPFKSGVKPSVVWDRFGYGQPNLGEIAWDGRFLQSVGAGARVPNGLYYVRVEVGYNGGVKDDTARVFVSLPQFTGRAYDPATFPATPLSAVQMRVYGPAGSFNAATGSDGSYVLPGLGAGNYRINLTRTDYADGALDATLNAGGSATSFTPRTTGLAISSNAAGGIDFFLTRSPRLTVVPSLDPSVAAAAADQWGSLQVRPSTASAQLSTFYGPMRLKGGTTTFDDGGQWDSSTAQFIAKTELAFNVPSGTYTVVADLTGYSRSTGSVYVGPDGARLDLTPFLPKAVINGTVTLPVAAPAGGVSVGITATALSTSVATTGLSGGAFVNGGQTSAAYSLSGFDPGAYLLRANTQGLSAVTTGPIVVSGTATVSAIHFSTFGAGVSITGTITAAGAPNGTQIFVNAWSPGSFNFGSTVVYVTGGSASYAMPGLDSGATYQLYANINAQTDFDVVGGLPRKVIPPAVDNFTFQAASGVISGTIILPANSTDFTNVYLYGQTIASLHPDEVGHNFVEVSTDLPNFLCADGSSGATGYCPAGISSATFRVQGVNTQTIDVRFLHASRGQSTRQTVSVVNGSTVALIADLRASTFSISGFLINQIADPLFNSNDKILANAPYIKPLNWPAGLSSSTARVIATRQEIDSFGVAISTVFDPLSSRVGFLDASGNYNIPNCPNGAYIVRTADLRSCATCAIVAPSVGRTVTISGASVSSVTLTVSNGYSVSGAIALDGGMLDAQVFDVFVLNKRQEVVRSTVAYLGDVNLGQQSGSVDYSFTNLPAGEFYTLTVRGQGFPVKYAGRPIKFPDAALSPTGLQSNLSAQNVLLQRAAYLTGRLKDGGTGELIGALNATLLAPNFAITATANPWIEGGFSAAASSVSARPIQSDGYFRVGPLVPDVSYDLRLAQAAWDPNFLASGSQNYAPVTIGGLKPTPGEIRDLGVIALGQGQSVSGVVKSTTTGLPLGNIKVTARPSFGGDDLVVQTFTNGQGAYSLWVSSAVSNQFSLVAAPRGGNQASDGKYYGTVSLSNVNLQTQTSANFLLTPLTVVVTGQLSVATGEQFSYPFGDKRGFPAAAINMQPLGVVPTNPLGDIEAVTDQSGNFSVPGLSTGLYNFHATSLGYSVYNATVSVIGSSFSIFTGTNTPAAPITLSRGATATGRIIKSDGSSPNSTEVVGVAAANFGAGEFVVGSVETDPVAKTVNAYTVSGFKPGIAYNIVLLSGSKGKEVSFPPEGAGVVFTAAESSTTKTINLTYRPATLDCLGTAKALDAARTQFSVQIDCLKPLRQQTAADDDLTSILTVSAVTSGGSALASPNSTGVLASRVLSSDRRRLTGLYTTALNESRFSMRVRASAAEINPATGDSFAIDKVFDFYAGLDSSADGRASNINGGSVGMNPSAQDELLGLDERSGITLPPGAFGEGSDSLPDSSVVAQPTTTVNVSMTKGRDQQLAKALSVATLGYAPAALEVADVPSAFPSEMWAAMSQYRTQASTTQVGGANPISAFYSIFLPAGIRHQLKKPADLTLSYNLATSSGTTDDKIQVWFYNAVLGRFVLESTNRRLDTVNKTVTVSVDHFSTFVVLDSTPTATSTVSFGGADIAVANFPNPADCIVHSNIARNSTLFGSGGVHQPFTGTMFRASIPLTGAVDPLKYNIYTVAGEKIRTIDQGSVPAGQTYYTPWNCTNDAGRTVASGVYIGEVIHGGRRKFFKIAIIKGSGL